MGKFVNADEAFEAWTSGDLRRMLAARSLRTNPIDRHFLLRGIVKEAYRRRVDPEMRSIYIETGLMHLEEFGTIAPALQKDMGGSLPRVPSFAWLATVMAEVGRVEDAVRVCEEAARFGADAALRAVIAVEAKDSERSTRRLGEMASIWKSAADL